MDLAAKHAPVATSVQMLERLAAALELGQDDLGRMFCVSGESVRRWRTGATGIPAHKRARIAEASAGLDRLEHIFLPASLAAATRRKAEAFEGEAAIDWILRGRVRDVADIYEFVLSYQG